MNDKWLLSTLPCCSSFPHLTPSNLLTCITHLKNTPKCQLDGAALIENAHRFFAIGAERGTKPLKSMDPEQQLFSLFSQINESRRGRNRRGASLSKRALMVAAMSMATAMSLSHHQANAASGPMEEPSVGKSLLRVLGVGDADIYYPSAFEGTWDCYSRLVDIETPQGEDKVDVKSLEFSRKQLGYLVKYQARFIPFNGKVIGDRLFTTTSLVESTLGKDVITGGIWSPEHPNRLVLMLRGGTKVENLVTRRSSEMSAAGRFDTSEYSKQVFDNMSFKDGPPLIKASQNITRYHWDVAIDQVSTIEAFQRVAMFPLPGEKIEDLLRSQMDKPTTIYKYLIRFDRVTSFV